MTQHITILSATEVSPETAAVWRDDQVVMWGFAPGANLEWPLPSELPPGQTSPIWFSNSPEYAEWVGTIPGPVGNVPEGQPDQRFYVAMAQQLMPNGETAMYNYSIIVKTSDTKTLHRIYKRGDILIDPDIENQSQP